MITVAEAFDKFRQNLELTDTEQKDAQKRHTEVRECIRGKFDIKRDFLTGSYGRHTKTKPLKDIDIFFVLGAKEADRRKETPSKMLDAFENCLIDKYGSDKVERGRRCVTVEFDKVYQTQDQDGKVLSIDAVPAFEKGQHFEIPDDVLGAWIESDPEIHSQQATEKNKELDGKWKPLVKMLKRWNREAKKPIKPSFLLEVMARGLIDAPFTSYPDEIIDFFSAAQGCVGDEWPDPAGLGPPVSDQMDPTKIAAATEALRTAEKIAVRAQRAESQGNISEALALWRQLFGSYFPQY
jgi:predicted nucleotidyltransferase